MPRIRVFGNIDGVGVCRGEDVLEFLAGHYTVSGVRRSSNDDGNKGEQACQSIRNEEPKRAVSVAIDVHPDRDGPRGVVAVVMSVSQLVSIRRVRVQLLREKVIVHETNCHVEAHLLDELAQRSVPGQIFVLLPLRRHVRIGNPTRSLVFVIVKEDVQIRGSQ